MVSALPASAGAWRAIIVDDERLARRELRTLLDGIRQVEIVGEAGSVAEARALLSRLAPDIAFLDIRLGRGSGFDLVDAIPEECAIVFVTAYDEHALRAFEVNALDYLLKPVDPARLQRAVERITHGRDAASVRPASPTGRLQDSDWLFLPLGDRRTFVRLKDVAYLAADGDYVIFHTGDGRAIRTNTPLTQWEARLPTSFLRIHRRTIINLDFVTNVEPWSHYSYQITLRGVAEPLSMSRRFALKAKELLG
jgi:two-component system LytT family response regulator